MEGKLKDSANRSTLDQLADDAHKVRAQNIGDPLVLQNFDHPGVTLVTSILTSNNYPSWSCSIKVALTTKVKLGFIKW